MNANRSPVNALFTGLLLLLGGDGEFYIVLSLQYMHIPESYSFCIGIALGFADETPKMKNRELNRILFME